MATNIVWSTLHLGNISDMDTSEGSYSIEDSSEILSTFGSSGDPLFNHVVDVTTNSSDNNVLNSDNTGTSDTLSYDLGAGTVVAQLDSLPLMAGIITFNDGSTLTVNDLSVFQDTNGNLFLAIRDDQSALAAQGIESVQFTSVVGSSYSGLTQTTRDDLQFVCYARGTRIKTPTGEQAVESLRVDEFVESVDRGPAQILWKRTQRQPLEEMSTEDRPVLIKAGALGVNLPYQNLVVSPQHRLLVGGNGQLLWFSDREALVPAKALTSLPGIRHMNGKREIDWVHFACRRHEIVLANGAFSESLLLGPMAIEALTPIERLQVLQIFGPAKTADSARNGPPARRILGAAKARRCLSRKTRVLNPTA